MHVINLLIRILCAAIVWSVVFFTGRAYQATEIYIFGRDKRIMLNFSIAASVVLVLLMALL